MNIRPTYLKSLAFCSHYVDEDTAEEDKHERTKLGTRVHDALAKDNPSGLKDAKELEYYEFCQGYVRNILLQFGGFHPGTTILREAELPYLDNHFGHPDIIIQPGKFPFKAVVLDWKFGINPVDKPSKNIQAKCYALATFRRFPNVTKVQFIYVQPPRDEIKAFNFPKSHAPKIEIELRNILNNRGKGFPKLNQNCQYCAVISTCRAVKKALKPRTPEPMRVWDLTELPGHPDRINQALNAKAWLEKFTKDWGTRVKDLAKEALEEGTAIGDWQLHERAGSRKVSDIPEASRIAAELGLSDDFTKACSVSLAELPPILVAELEQQNLIKRGKTTNYLKKTPKVL